MSREWEHVYSARGRQDEISAGIREPVRLRAAVRDRAIPDVVIRAAGLCDRLGIDTISAGGTIAWAMESYRTGDVLTPADTNDLELRFGSKALSSSQLSNR